MLYATLPASKSPTKPGCGDSEARNTGAKSSKHQTQVGLAASWRLPLTVATHLSLVYAGFLVLSWQAGVPKVAQASLVPIAVPSGVGLYVLATILASCLLSFAVTHLLYLRAVREEIRALAGRLQDLFRSRRDNPIASGLHTRLSGLAP